MSKSIKLSKKIVDIIRKQGFHCNDEVVEQNGKYFITIYRQTSIGKEWNLSLWFDGKARTLQEYIKCEASEFDVNEETKYWVLQIGQKGCPEDVECILKYAKWKKETLLNLANALAEVSEDTYILNRAILKIVVNYAGTSFFTNNSDGYFQEHDSLEKARDFLIKQYGTDAEIEVETSVRFSY